MKFKEFINDFAETAKHLIGKYEEYKELKGEEKKERVDEALLKWSLNTLDSVPINAFFKFVIKNILKNYLDDFTQIIFNLIQTKIIGITK